MANLRLTFACGPFDRTMALRAGSIKPDGIDLVYLAMQPAEIFWRMLQFNEFDISEMSMANYSMLVAHGDRRYVAIPAFPSRVFRHGYFFINTNKGIKSPADLIGKRGGVPEYSQTASVYMRGLLQHEYGVRPSDVEWVQGRADRLKHAFTANNPLSFRRGAPSVQRLFPNYVDMEKDYYRRTQIYPIMHTIVIRRDIYERDPWIAMSMYKAMCEAKNYACRWIMEGGSAKVTSAWLQPLIEEEQSIIGTDWFPYGIEKNRPTLDALLLYLHEQGLAARRVGVEELFAPSTLDDIPLTEGQRV
jgi:4,5-dihydroxyphthalate decarboxylase